MEARVGDRITMAARARRPAHARGHHPRGQGRGRRSALRRGVVRRPHRADPPRARLGAALRARRRGGARRLTVVTRRRSRRRPVLRPELASLQVERAHDRHPGAVGEVQVARPVDDGELGRPARRDATVEAERAGRHRRSLRAAPRPASCPSRARRARWRRASTTSSRCRGCSRSRAPRRRPRR